MLDATASRAWQAALTVFSIRCTQGQTDSNSLDSFDSIESSSPRGQLPMLPGRFSSVHEKGNKANQSVYSWIRGQRGHNAAAADGGAVRALFPARQGLGARNKYGRKQCSLGDAAQRVRSRQQEAQFSEEASESASQWGKLRHAVKAGRRIKSDPMISEERKVFLKNKLRKELKAKLEAEAERREIIAKAMRGWDGIGVSADRVFKV